jgi:hypothetical protein
MHSEDHLEIQGLLPWYVTGRLDGAERARVESHLGACPDCQSELRFQRRLDAEIVQLPLDVDQSWRQMRERLGQSPDRPTGGAWTWLQSIFHPKRASGPSAWLGWAVASVAVAVSAALVILPSSPEPAAAYRALSSAGVSDHGNLVVMFRPETPERAIRELLHANRATLVGGPTETGGYELRVDPSHRDQALADLRQRPSVTLAQPLDSAGAP